MSNNEWGEGEWKWWWSMIIYNNNESNNEYLIVSQLYKS